MTEFQEIVIGETLNEENEKIFDEFVETFGEYVVMESGPQTALLSELFFENEDEAIEKMRLWLGSKGLDEDAWGLQ